MNFMVRNIAQSNCNTKTNSHFIFQMISKDTFRTILNHKTVPPVHDSIDLLKSIHRIFELDHYRLTLLDIIIVCV